MAKKIGLAAAAVLIVATAVLLMVYRNAHGQEWETRNAAIQTVTENTYMRTVDRVESFIGEKPYRIVFGKDPDGREAIVWVTDDSVHMEYISSGVSEQSVRQTVMGRQAENEILRVLPAELNGIYMWEVFYKRPEGDATGYYYDYYRFSDGVLYDTWRLSKRK